MINQALAALREILLPPGGASTGLVTAAAAGQYSVATKKGTRPYPAAPGLDPREGQRVVLEGGVIVRILGADTKVPVHYV